MSDLLPSDPVCIHICGPRHSGSGRDVAGKMHYWDFHDYLGPTFTDKDGNVLAKQPMSPRNRAWKPFEEWLAIKRLKGDIK